MQNQISLTVNGIKHNLEPVPGETLSTLLRQRLRLIGTKIGCDEAECGACTVLIDGEPVVSCIYPAERADGKTVVTIEGLAQRVHEEMKLHPLQEAFVEQARLLAIEQRMVKAEFEFMTLSKISAHPFACASQVACSRRREPTPSFLAPGENDQLIDQAGIGRAVEAGAVGEAQHPQHLAAAFG